MKSIWLKSQRDQAIRRQHPWVFSGAIARQDDDIQDGDQVQVRAKNDELLATGHYQNGSIRVRIFDFGSTELPPDFWYQKLERAYRVRHALDLAQSATTDCYRLVHGEGDGLPGLIVDVYGNTAVLQCHSIGMHQARQSLAAALQQLYGSSLQVYDKSQASLPERYAATQTDGILLEGKAAHTRAVVREHGHAFWVDWAEGQKTGFFLDQRANRVLLANYAAGQRVLNCFCYTGGFSVYALVAGARWVESVDVSARAMSLLDQNISLNNSVNAAQHRSVTADVMKYLRTETTQQEPYDIVVVDPPAFAKSVEKRHNAVQAYKRLNALALERVKPGGLLFTFSCSQVVGRDLFYNTIVAAGMEVGRTIRVLHHLGQGPDHPVSLFHPEGEYLKGLVLHVE